MNLVDHAPDAFLRRPQGNIFLPCLRRISPSKRVTQEIKLSCRNLADSCLLFVYRQLQLAHDRTHPLQGLFCLAAFAQDYEVVRIGNDSTAKFSLKSQRLPRQYE